MVTSLNEESLEALIVAQMTGDTASDAVRWVKGDPGDYDRAHAVDLTQLTAFLEATQPSTAEALDLGQDSTTRRAFLARLQGEVTKHGGVAALRNGIQHGPHTVDLYYPTPTPGNTRAADRFALNRFTITRQLRYSPTDTGRALDLAVFVNGLPLLTFELKNSITKQTVEEAVEQYKRDRDPRELLFAFGRCMAHLAVDDHRARFCTRLAGKASWFLPFDQGFNDGAGNPPNPDGLATDYLWRRILAPDSLSNIIENYAQIVTVKNPQTGKKTSAQIFPRYHQLDVVRRLLADVETNGAGQRYLIEHSAGSGKSNSIAWLAHQLTTARHEGGAAFDSVIVVTDRKILDRQIEATIKGFTQVGSTVVHADRSADLRTAIEAGKKVIVTTVQKFPYIVANLGTAHRDRRFAIIIDEAHSSQGGKATAALATSLSAAGLPVVEGEEVEDQLNRLMAAKKMPANASYFAFTATPKNKTLETFGEPFPQPDGQTGHRPFHAYTMKQAIGEGFILDVLANYVPVDSYYKLIKTVEDDPEFDASRASKKLRHYVESNRHAIRLKAEIMVDHFHTQVLAKQKIKGQARAMVVTSSIDRAIDYYEAISAYLTERKSPYRAIVAFSDTERDGVKVTESDYNGFPSKEIPDRIREDPYRILVCADKFQTGYDEPLLHTMYVDKTLSGVKAVQTLSRLNRAHPDKRDVAILDFANDADAIEVSFAPYYRTTVLAEETDPNKLHDLAGELRVSGVFTPEHVDTFVERYLAGVDRDQLDPLLDACAAEYIEHLDEDDQIAFKGSAKAFLRTYGFLSAILPYSNVEWEKLSIFLDHLVPKLPAPKEDDLAAGILETVDMDSYRVEKRTTMAIALADEDGELDPVPAAGGGMKPDPDLERLSLILASFNDQFGNIEWDDADRVRKRITEEIPARVAEDVAYQNAQKNNDPVNARIELDKALGRVVLSMMRDETQLFKQFSDNDSFRAWLADAVFRQTYGKSA
ncbi:type I restriction endonuclease subunit R [Actinotalea sp. K2]|uniref:type I restriction endonuclease subunit R n=1 Tax=Actinotalea sp. K2 TaxID=2939438 RepID=UPI00201741AE|nr:type I restriction endonuclease [Actinotalea sp. K2]MCL3861737.1 type I restriction endonuclease [Actinotalea sp. K2]